jgi:sulfatase maturation enzyme AslB (radical SAM superfamily)
MKESSLTQHPQTRLKVRAGPCGIHMFNRRTGANILIDEAKVPATMWAKAPRQVSVALTNTCDLRCPYCYAPKYQANLDSMHLMEWLNEFDENGCLGVGFGGGEPTLHPDLPLLCRYVTESTGLAVTFTTHAHRLDDRIAADLRGNVHFIRVSMDGVGATYEMLRGRPFSTLRCRLDIIRELAPFGINFVVNALTMADLDAALTLAAEVGASEFLLLPEQPVHGREGIDSRTIRELHRWVKSYRGTIPLSISEMWAGGLPARCNHLAGETGLRAYAHIDASGVIKRSSYDESGVPVGSGGVMHALKMLELTTGGDL